MTYSRLALMIYQSLFHEESESESLDTGCVVNVGEPQLEH
jgi:hypothetical protein